MSATSSFNDRHGQAVVPGDLIRVLDVTPDPEMDEDDLDLILDMVGTTCEVERIDEQGLAWVSVWWNDYGSTFSTSVALTSAQLEKID
jgi:hypothetical protein